jgi:hypothetical protein
MPQKSSNSMFTISFIFGGASSTDALGDRVVAAFCVLALREDVFRCGSSCASHSGIARVSTVVCVTLVRQTARRSRNRRAEAISVVVSQAHPCAAVSSRSDAGEAAFLHMVLHVGWVADDDIACCAAMQEEFLQRILRGTRPSRRAPWLPDRIQVTCW